MRTILTLIKKSNTLMIVPLPIGSIYIKENHFENLCKCYILDLLGHFIKAYRHPNVNQSQQIHDVSKW